jgi:hypothetical protein
VAQAGTGFFDTALVVFVAKPPCKLSDIAIDSPVIGGSGLSGKSGRNTANACDTSAKQMSTDTAAHRPFEKQSFTEDPAFSCNRAASAADRALPPSR